MRSKIVSIIRARVALFMSISYPSKILDRSFRNYLRGVKRARIDDKLRQNLEMLYGIDSINKLMIFDG